MSQSKEDSKPKSVKFNFTLSSEGREFFDNLIYTNVVKGNLHYNLKSAFLEGLFILQDKNPEIPSRNTTKRRYNKRGKSKSEVKGYVTSILSTLEINEWIEDYICYKINFSEVNRNERGDSDHIITNLNESIPGVNIYYTKSLFVKELITLLEKKYKGKLLKIPRVHSI